MHCSSLYNIRATRIYITRREPKTPSFLLIVLVISANKRQSRFLRSYLYLESYFLILAFIAILLRFSRERFSIRSALQTVENPKTNLWCEHLINQDETSTGQGLQIQINVSNSYYTGTGVSTYLASFAAVFRLVPPHKRLLNRAIHSFPIVFPIRQSNQSRSRKESF